MPAFSICVATLTFRRNQELARLLPLLQDQALALSTSRLLDVSILVVDNSPEQAARSLTRSLAEQSPVPCDYRSEPTPGISAGRNAALDANPRTDLLAFIDDDEIPSPGWLMSLVDTFERYEPAGVAGPVVPRFDGTPPQWIVDADAFGRPNHPTGTVVAGGGAGNLLLDLRFLRHHDLMFDLELGLIGGEDTLLTRRMRKAGGRIVWSSDAVVTDVIPASRMTRSWALRRRFRFGAAGVAASLKLESSTGRRLWVRFANLGLGAAEALREILRWFAGLVTRSPVRRARAERDLARAIGRFTGSLGLQYREYGRLHSATPPKAGETTAHP